MSAFNVSDDVSRFSAAIVFVAVRPIKHPAPTPSRLQTLPPLIALRVVDLAFPEAPLPHCPPPAAPP
ncbi:hypothetical protein, partial [Achromobacter ruhlandii]|uniref:hypothetical protein n=1 Tax=Achromobacter ruhlandii TaxID=72557 RepID=UPI001B8D5FD4